MERATHTLVVAAAVSAALWIPISGRTADSPLQTAALAWDRGDVSALKLNTYLQILESSAADTSFETIAVQTGELFKTIELTTDGAAPRFPPTPGISHARRDLRHRARRACCGWTIQRNRSRN